MNFEQIFLLRDVIEETLRNKIFKDYEKFIELYTECDQQIVQTDLENYDWI